MQLSSASDLTASQLMNKDVSSVKPGERLSKLKDKLVEQGLSYIVVEDNDFKGVVDLRDLLKSVNRDPKSTKITKAVSQPPMIDENMDLLSLARKRIESGARVFVSLDQGKLKGVVDTQSMLNALANGVEELKGLKAQHLSSELIHVFRDDKYQVARDKLVNKNVARLPVLDNQEELAGIVRGQDVLKVMIHKFKMKKGEVVGEKKDLSTTPIKEIMHLNPLSADQDISVTAACQLMVENKADEIILTENSRPVGILTPSDIFGYLAQVTETEGVMVNLTGVEVPEERAAINRKVEKAIKGSLGRILDRPDELNVVYQKSGREGSRHRYSITLRLHSELGVTETEVEGWDLLNVVDQALEKLETTLKRSKQKKKDLMRKRERKAKDKEKK